MTPQPRSASFRVDPRGRAAPRPRYRGPCSAARSASSAGRAKPRLPRHPRLHAAFLQRRNVRHRRIAVITGDGDGPELPVLDVRRRRVDAAELYRDAAAQQLGAAPVRNPRRARGRCWCRPPGISMTPTRWVEAPMMFKRRAGSERPTSSGSVLAGMSGWTIRITGPCAIMVTAASPRWCRRAAMVHVLVERIIRQEKV